MTCKLASVAIIAALTLSSTLTFAGGGNSGEYAPIIEVGTNFYTGNTGTSITGALGYQATFRAERRKGNFRTTMAADFSYAMGSTTVSESTSDFSLMGVGFLGGIHFFPFLTGRFQPFLGGSGVCSWNFLKLAAPPTNIEPNTQGMAYGYELAAGVDLRFGSSEGNAIRLKGTIWNISSTLAGVSGFQLTGFRLMIGIVY